MLGSIIILFITIAIYIPIAGVLLYVWWKHGKNENGIMFARVIFLIVSVLLFMYMLAI